MSQRLTRTPAAYWVQGKVQSEVGRKWPLWLHQGPGPLHRPEVSYTREREEFTKMHRPYHCFQWEDREEEENEAEFKGVSEIKQKAPWTVAPGLPWDVLPVLTQHLGLTSVVYQVAQEQGLPLVPGAEAGEDGTEAEVREVTVFDETVPGRWLPTHFAGQQQKHFRPFPFFQ